VVYVKLASFHRVEWYGVIFLGLLSIIWFLSPVFLPSAEQVDDYQVDATEGGFVPHHYQHVIHSWHVYEPNLAVWCSVTLFVLFTGFVINLLVSMFHRNTEMKFFSVSTTRKYGEWSDFSRLNWFMSPQSYLKWSGWNFVTVHRTRSRYIINAQTQLLAYKFSPQIYGNTLNTNGDTFKDDLEAHLTSPSAYRQMCYEREIEYLKIAGFYIEQAKYFDEARHAAHLPTDYNEVLSKLHFQQRAPSVMLFIWEYIICTRIRRPN